MEKNYRVRKLLIKMRQDIIHLNIKMTIGAWACVTHKKQNVYDTVNECRYTENRDLCKVVQERMTTHLSCS